MTDDASGPFHTLHLTVTGATFVDVEHAARTAVSRYCGWDYEAAEKAMKRATIDARPIARRGAKGQGAVLYEAEVTVTV